MEGKRWIAPDSEGYAFLPLQRFFEDQSLAGYRSVSLWGGSPHIFVDCYGYENPAEIKTMMERFRIGSVCYRPQSYGYAFGAPRGSMLWEATLDYYRFSAELASGLKAPVMVVEVGVELRDEDRVSQIDSALDGVRRLGAECKSQGVCLALAAGTKESGALINSVEGMKDFLAQAGEGVKAAFHAEAAISAGESLADWIRVFGRNLCHVRSGKRAEALAGMDREPRYTGYYECVSSPEAVWAYNPDISGGIWKAERGQDG